MMKRYEIIGIILTLLGATLWGVSGTSVQFVGNFRNMNLEWLLTMRLITAGLLTVLYGWIRQGSAIFNVFRNWRDTLGLVIFGVFGMALCQYTYFRSIVIAGAGIATVLQYLAPSMIIIYLLMRYGKRPSTGEIISVILALAGTICLMGNNGFSFESFRSDVLFWGLLSAVGVAVYSVSPVRLLATYGTIPIVGFGMLLSGLVAAVLFQQPHSYATWDVWTVVGCFNVVFLGTIVSFNAYLEGVKRIGAVSGSILSSIEPISAAFFGWALLGNQFNWVGILGMAMIIATVIIIALEKRGQSS
ncbi:MULTISPECIES: DMT family transporter [unclassified Veillonella]|uniref:DMT family transporter n=1 Tax=unclassified Veillonella TaxID=2630086 RepID=UPI000CF536C4|nr:MULTISPECIES: EamA family transporter [unclassified Veillonella]MDU6570939.1 EamA family transporter [Veillonella sp.]MDU6596244.1 EamA family transporter [Veillonella sp.]PQL24451.1 EamA family transporter [Veillonella sp. T34266-5]